MNALPVSMVVHDWCLKTSEEAIRSSRLGIIDGCELPCRWWEPNLASLQEKQVLLIAEPSLQVPPPSK